MRVSSRWVSKGVRRLQRFVGRSWTGVFEFILPAACPLCGAPLDLSSPWNEDIGRRSGTDARECGVVNDQLRSLAYLRLPAVVPLCDDCRSKVLNTASPGCWRCGMPVGPYADTTGGCAACRRRRFHFSHVVRLGTYVDCLREACVRAKDRGGRPLAAALALLLWQVQGQRLVEHFPDLVVPVPQHWTKRITTTHNSAAVLAEVLARCLKARFHENILAKTRLTPDQSVLPAEKRRQNLRGAFQIRNPSAVREKTVLLVDDILTTGTTADRCAETLRRAGAKRVVVAVLAVVPKRP